MSELFSIQLQNRQQQGRDGIWLDLPTTTEQVQAALRQIDISSDNPQGLFILPRKKSVLPSPTTWCWHPMWMN